MISDWSIPGHPVIGPFDLFLIFSEICAVFVLLKKAVTAAVQTDSRVKVPNSGWVPNSG